MNLHWSRHCRTLRKNNNTCPYEKKPSCKGMEQIHGGCMQKKTIKKKKINGHPEPAWCHPFKAHHVVYNSYYSTRRACAYRTVTYTTLSWRIPARGENREILAISVGCNVCAHPCTFSMNNEGALMVPNGNKSGQRIPCNKGFSHIVMHLPPCSIKGREVPLKKGFPFCSSRVYH